MISVVGARHGYADTSVCVPVLCAWRWFGRTAVTGRETSGWQSEDWTTFRRAVGRSLGHGGGVRDETLQRRDDGSGVVL